jgi:hypothetical protein
VIFAARYSVNCCLLGCLLNLRLDTGAPSGYLDPYLQVFLDKNPYLDLQGSFPTVHLDPQVFYLQVTGQQVLKVPAGIQ